MPGPYDRHPLLEHEAAENWLEQFRRWLAEAQASPMPEPDAMVVSTAGELGLPSSRFVLLRGVDERGFIFFTNYESRKAQEAASNPRACLLFPWLMLGRQVIVTGQVSRIDAESSDAYWALRPRGSQLGALASPQSQVLASREELDQRFLAIEESQAGVESIPRPDHWGGLRVEPHEVEYWQGRPNRLHDRLRYRRDDSSGTWLLERLAP